MLKAFEHFEQIVRGASMHIYYDTFYFPVLASLKSLTVAKFNI